MANGAEDPPMESPATKATPLVMPVTTNTTTTDQQAAKKENSASRTRTANSSSPNQKRWRRRPDEESPPRFPTVSPAPSSCYSTEAQRSTPLNIMQENDLSSAQSAASWTKRIPWMRAASKQNGGLEGDGLYYISPRPEQLSPDSSYAKQQKSKGNFFGRTFSNLSSRGDDDVDNFEDSEWTPQDSAYGAACPVCGCLPKNVRRAIEATLIGSLLMLLIYLLVTTSIKLTNEKNADNNNNKNDNDDQAASGVNLDDDYYVENHYNYRDDDYAANNAVDDDAAQDDYFENDDADAAADDGGYDKNDDDYYSEIDDDANGGRRRYLRSRSSYHNMRSWLFTELLMDQPGELS